MWHSCCRSCSASCSSHLDLRGSCLWYADEGGFSPSLAVYASLTANSRLQHLDFTWNTLPSAAWQYMCPPGRMLPQLRYLDISCVREAFGRSWALPDTSALFRCCPGLQSLTTNMPCSTAQLAPLQRLTGLQSLALGAGGDDDLEGVQALCQLAGLQDLQLVVSHNAEARFLQLTQLTRLTGLRFPHRGLYGRCLRHSQDPASEPVWRQLQQLFVDSPDAEVAQQAAAGLDAA